MEPADTRPDARRVQLEALRALGPDGRSELVESLSEDIRLVTLAGIRERTGEDDEAAQVGELIALWHGPAAAAAVARRFPAP